MIIVNDGNETLTDVVVTDAMTNPDPTPTPGSLPTLAMEFLRNVIDIGTRD